MFFDRIPGTSSLLKRVPPAFLFLEPDIETNVETVFKSSTEVKLLSLFEKALEDSPYRVVDCDCRMSGKSVLRIFIENTQTHTATIGDCTKLSFQLDPVIEASGIFTGPYELEVSSPGIDRRLRLKSDFESAIGKELKLDFIEKIDGVGGSARGTLQAVNDGEIAFSFQGKQLPIQLGKIKRAQLVLAQLVQEGIQGR